MEGAGGREIFSVAAGEKLAGEFPALPDVYRAYRAEAEERLRASGRQLP